MVQQQHQYGGQQQQHHQQQQQQHQASHGHQYGAQLVRRQLLNANPLLTGKILGNSKFQKRICKATQI
jgi:hypothetical protein